LIKALVFKSPPEGRYVHRKYDEYCILQIPTLEGHPPLQTAITLELLPIAIKKIHVTYEVFGKYF